MQHDRGQPRNLFMFRLLDDQSLKPLSGDPFLGRRYLVSEVVLRRAFLATPIRVTTRYNVAHLDQSYDHASCYLFSQRPKA